jgi:GDP-mannose 6-dehydrogenase
VSRLLGANREYIDGMLPHLGDLLCGSVDEVLDHADLCVVGTKDPVVLDALTRAGDRIILDLVRLPDAQQRRSQPGYIGIGW